MTDAEFREMVADALTRHSVETIANKLLVSYPTVRRWANGVTAPHEIMRAGVRRCIEWLDGRATANRGGGDASRS